MPKREGRRGRRCLCVEGGGSRGVLAMQDLSCNRLAVFSQDCLLPLAFPCSTHSLHVHTLFLGGGECRGQEIRRRLLTREALRDFESTLRWLLRSSSFTYTHVLSPSMKAVVFIETHTHTHA